MALFRQISRIGPDTAKTALAAGGMLAAFGVASCCALPIALSLLGISAASLVGIGYLAAQYQQELLYAAVACLSAAGWVMWRQRHAPSCASGADCPHPIAGRASSIAFGLGLALLGLTFWYETPMSVILESALTCPECGAWKTETMPTDACLYFYECTSCRTVLRAKPGDCCVFCSYGSMPCPPIQAGDAPDSCCQPLACEAG